MKSKINPTKADEAMIQEVTESLAESMSKPKKMEMDEIIQKSDTFETIRVIMEILCEKLGISKESQPKEIFDALRRVSEEYYKAMEEFGKLRKEASKNGQKDDIRQ